MGRGRRANRIVHSGKTRLIVRTIALFFAFSTFLCTCVRAQSTERTGPGPALDRAFEKGNLMVALSPVGWRQGLALAATKLQPGETISLELSLRRHHEYAFIASADDTGSDLDLYLRDSTGTVLASDQEPDATPILEFRVPRTGNYRLQLHLSATEKTEAWVGVALLQSGGTPIIENTYRQETDRFFTSANPLLADRQWATAPGNWPLMAFVIPPTSGQTLTGYRPSAGESTLAATASPEIRDLALYLANQQREIVARSRTQTAFPLLPLRTDGKQTYDLRIESKGHSVPGLVLLGAFQLQPDR